MTLSINAKARVAQLTGCPSIAAAAEWSVTFGDCSDRWTARLLSCLGSSAAQGIGGRVIAPLQVGFAYVGRVRTPAPTEHTKDCPGNAVGADDLGGPRAHTVRPYSGKRPRDVGSETAGAAVEAHHLKFFTKSGPQWGRTEPRSSTPDFARRKFSACLKG